MDKNQKNLEITKPRYSKHSFAGSSASRMSRFPLCFVKKNKNTLLPFSNTSTTIKSSCFPKQQMIFAWLEPAETRLLLSSRNITNIWLKLKFIAVHFKSYKCSTLIIKFDCVSVWFCYV